MQARTAILERLPETIAEMRAEIRWKPGSAARHLLKRKLREHLPSDATLADYEQIIQRVLTASDATVYLYRHEDVVYPTIVCPLAGKVWLVM